MCGIVCAFDVKESTEVLRPQLLEMSKKIRHRGPDWSGIYADDKAILAHERLAIVDPASGKQPLLSPNGKLILAANGEIYNHRELRKQFEGKYDFKTESDCEVILALYQEKGVDFIDEMNGIFGFTIYDAEKDEYFVARDHMGIIPLYMGWDKNGTFYVASELKALEGTCTKIELFPPGHYLHSSDGELKKWYSRDWMEYDAVKENETSIKEIKEALEAAVHRQLMSDVPYGVLLSGGLDSSVTSAIAKKYAQKRIESGDTADAWYPQLHSFSVGLEGSPDLAAAQKVADHIGTVHHEIKFTIQEGLDAIKDVVYNLETYDITTIRASTPMYLMARVIKSMGIKMVLSGEGADELFGGYLYFHKAPNAQEFHEETVRKLSKLHMYDCLRANKSLASWGIEGRVPFLDKEFMDVAMRINPQDKMINGERMEKWVVRKAFEDMLPESVAWRQKEQFSDGVGYSWIDTLKEVVNQEVSDEQLANAKFRFPLQTPTSKEEFYYRSIFEEHFPSDAAALCVPQEASVACSTQIALEWDEAFKNMNDPSGRAVAFVHDDAYVKQ
ncbi:MAG: asparagine synthase B [Maribacter dokdonensis]|jgi:asparagine synthase (glutamine-hydrolysing)|uniref:asparagine synthase (glutamine-hydrolyzing) n=3 Tax=Maribacter dokdonensis TaxID=320912 RepID=A0A1H4NY96_9FLAO|nr:MULTISPECIES: asparagine synthase B [Maribacter]APA65096.1 asparagine synthetase B [Maribacter sp. 1_2014MBL_MicDiv]KSA14754.1 Asparagine synthetase [Maribacter dokdonensis DSW-8]MBU2899858.1 asparagine synthase B [Maribacter dokdonensis]MDP2525316.1 asparagine synthase B [Maribacter dokdonensis]CAG2531323.1 asparagine synthase (glutamine-hydrolysing) [Maribacter dokdonensis]|tara:strand:- start:7435 stop:9108 length:1674 start_codon:yes stop_codon:yes gene_type:complete